MKMNKEKLTNLKLIIGILLISSSLFLNRYDQVSDFIKGLIFGIGMGLLVLFVIKKRKEKYAEEQR